MNAHRGNYCKQISAKAAHIWEGRSAIMERRK